VLRRIASAAVAGAALLAAFGCGSSGNDASVDSGTSRERTVSPAADPGASNSASNTASNGSSTVSADGTRTVTYRGVQFDVPGDWPVYDLAADPSTCVRFDVHAVYLGAPGPDMNCPAGIVGRADTVLVEPTAGSSDDAASGASDVSAATASGLEVQVATDSASTGEVGAAVPSAGVSVTLTYRDSDATAQQILQSFRAAS
jgi:hypothetical protein